MLSIPTFPSHFFLTGGWFLTQALNGLRSESPSPSPPLVRIYNLPFPSSFFTAPFIPKLRPYAWRFKDEGDFSSPFSIAFSASLFPFPDYFLRVALSAPPTVVKVPTAKTPWTFPVPQSPRRDRPVPFPTHQDSVFLRNFQRLYIARVRASSVLSDLLTSFGCHPKRSDFFSLVLNRAFVCLKHTPSTLQSPYGPSGDASFPSILAVPSRRRTFFPFSSVHTLSLENTSALQFLPLNLR